MGYRRSPGRVKASRDWRAFVARNQAVIEAAGLPLVVVESVEHWDDFLMHGFLDHHHDATGFTVDHLNEQQYEALVQLVESYFAAGYEYFSPSVLRDDDRRLMNDKFEKR